MINKSVKQLSKMMDIVNDVSSINETVINGVCIDTRKLEKGNLFVPFVGENVDGHKFVEEALKNGAAASLWQKDIPNPPMHLPLIIVEDTLQAVQQMAKNYRQQLDVKVIGITGSNGKTTTKDIIFSLLSQKYKVQKTEGNYNNHLGLPLTILQLAEDTQFAILEMGMSSRGEIRLLTNIARPEAVVITNVGESHLLHLGSRQAIAEAKLEIVEGLREDGLIVYNGDEKLLKSGLANYKGAAIKKTFGYETTNDLYTKNVRSLEKGNYFIVNKYSQELFLPILGTHNILNALAAMLIAENYGISIEQIAEALLTVKLTDMRMELIEGPKDIKIINDAYNASPTSMRAALKLISDLPNSRVKIAVLGDILELGPNEVEYHENIGKLLDPNKINYVFTYGELGAKIAKGALNNYSTDRVFSFTNKTELIKKLKETIDGEEIILLKGSRGMRLEEIAKALLN